ncbi:MAG: hypothetical protein KKG91_06250 [Candidatus Omnitrophica bacterium]|nr:hypothetical protein [Candidatus Omnitrophota bacterium]
MKKVIFLTVSLAGLVFFSGCSTVYNTARGFGKGLAEDIHSTWQTVDKADKWVEENAW